MTVASARPYANHFHLPADITHFFTGQVLFLTPDQQCTNTEGSLTCMYNQLKYVYGILFITANVKVIVYL